MIAADTNLIIRHLTGDDAEQAKKVVRVIDRCLVQLHEVLVGVAAPHEEARRALLPGAHPRQQLDDFQHICFAQNGGQGPDAPIPASILRRAPTAELAPRQRDQDTLPPYKTLDRILEAYVEKDRSLPEIFGRNRLEPATVKRVLGMVDRSEYKRRQGPPGIKITPRAFGKDRRMPITNRYRQY